MNPEAKLKVLNDFVRFVSAHPEYEADLVDVTTLVDNDEKPKKPWLELAAILFKIWRQTKGIILLRRSVKARA